MDLGLEFGRRDIGLETRSVSNGELGACSRRRQAGETDGVEFVQ